EGFPKIRLQEAAAQWKFKLSYYVADDFNADDLANIYKRLDDHRLKANILLTDNLYLDFLPRRASKGNALKYLSYKWKTPLQQFITAGNGGNDLDMLRGKAKGIVVSNYSPELAVLRKSKDVYFAEKEVAQGVMEGIQYYQNK
ncbi:MAG: HAD family hydrolase, partial [Bacteroidota bacterium]